MSEYNPKIHHSSCRVGHALNTYDDSIPAHVEQAVDRFKAEAQSCMECGQDYNGTHSLDVSECVGYIVDSINDGELSDATMQQIVHAALLALDDQKQAVLAARLVRDAVRPFIKEFVAGKADELESKLLKGE